jgi:hypothetical protein
LPDIRAQAISASAARLAAPAIPVKKRLVTPPIQQKILHPGIAKNRNRVVHLNSTLEPPLSYSASHSYCGVDSEANRRRISGRSFNLSFDVNSVSQGFFFVPVYALAFYYKCVLITQEFSQITRGSSCQKINTASLRDVNWSAREFN